MKKKTFVLAIGTAFIVGAGSFALVLSMRQVKNNIQTELSSDKTIETSQVYETATMETDSSEQILTDETKDEDIVLFKTFDYSMTQVIEMSPAYQEEFEIETEGLSSAEITWRKLKKLEEVFQDYRDGLGKTSFVYEGKRVGIEDALLEKEDALENGKKIMDFVYDYVDKTIFEPYEIDKTQYNYSIRRQYHMVEGVNYAVFLHEKTNSEILATIGILIEEEPVLQSFARDGLIELVYGSGEIPKTYWVKNWCETMEKREMIYTQYLEESKKIITMLGLPPIVEEIKNLDSISYFDADNGWSTVTFGYVLEDGTYVKIFYNRINGKWNGFSIAGYHKDYVKTTVK